MESRKTVALHRLKTALLRRFGPENEAVVIREIQRKICGKDKIAIADLDEVETVLMQELGRKGTSKRQAVTPDPRRRRISLFPTTPEACRGKTDLNTSVPSVSDLVPINTGKRILAPVSSVLFPRFDETSVEITHFSPYCQRDRSPFDHGLPENQRFQGYSRRQLRRLPDSWGKVLKWDTAKYMQEEENRKAQRLLVRSSYRKDLDLQVERKKQAVLTASQEASTFKAELSVGLAAFEAEKAQKTALKAAKKEQQKTVLGLLQAIAREQEESRKIAIRIERSQLDQLVGQEKQHTALLKLRKKALMLSIQSDQMQVAASKLQQARNQRAQSQAHTRLALSQDKAAFEEHTKKAKETTFLRDKELSAANLTSAALRKSKSGTETTAKMDEMRLFVDADKRAAVSQQLRKEVLTVLAKQRKEHEEGKQHRAKEDWVQVESGRKDREKAEKQQDMRRLLQAQVEERNRRLEEERQFSQAEMQLNRPLFEAVFLA